MDISRKPADVPRRWSGFVLIGVAAGIGLGWGLASMGRPRAATPEVATPAGPSAEETRVALGRELFHREWTPGDPRARGGDGLGPVFNDTSCVACHNLGGPGGGGPANKNVDIVTGPVASPTIHWLRAEKADPGPARAAGTKPERRRGGATATAVLPRFGTNPGFSSWRVQRLREAGFAEPGFRGGVGEIDSPLGLARAELASARLGDPLTSRGGAILRSQRNSSSMLGAGLIDAIPEAAIVTAADRRFPNFPDVTGRVSRVKDGALGRFGWKGQVASLNEFVRTACSVELGLEVPGHAQSSDPIDPDQDAPGLDLDDADCDALTAYVRSLAPPAQGIADAETTRAGRETFTTVGCATCHMPDLGLARGIYSDLSLHDMGREMGDAGSHYGVPTGPSPSSSPEVATATEWRTPPLWGVRDSAPYLHDGRAETLEQAIAFHGGEAKAPADRFFGLPPGKRRQVLAFLNTLGTPAEN